MARDVPPPTADDLRRAAATVAAALPPTPLLASPRLGVGVHLKTETMQPTGSFKVRGALAALTALPPETPAVCASAGNHALGLAWAAGRLGRRATVVVPVNGSPAKLRALADFDVHLVRRGTSYDEAERHAFALARDGAHFVSPYNDTQVMAGQASIGAELEGLDAPLTVICPIGGGGLLAGLACWAGERGDIRLIGVEAAASTAMSQALQRRPRASIEPTLADGMAGGIEPGSTTITLAARRVDDLVAVDDEAIAAAIRFLASEHGLVAEGAGAAAVAALMGGAVDRHGTTVALVTGRNIALARLAPILAEDRDARPL